MQVLGLRSTAGAAELPEGSIPAARAGTDGHEQPQDLLTSGWWVTGDLGDFTFTSRAQGPQLLLSSSSAAGVTDVAELLGVRKLDGS